MRVSAVARVEDAVLCFALEQELPPLAHRCWHPRAYGDFWAHMLVAEGAVDGAIDAVGVAVWDLAAIRPIVEEAGGRVHATATASRGSTGQRRLVERAPARGAARRMRGGGGAAALAERGSADGVAEGDRLLRDLRSTPRSGGSA